MEKQVAALFDFDGVVMDTETQYSLFWGKQGGKYHPEISNFDRIIKGQTLDQIFFKYFDGKNEVKEEIHKELNVFEEEMKYEYISGIQHFLNELRDKGVKIALVTSSDARKMKNVYRTHPEFKSLFDLILTAEFFAKSKPDPECYLLGAELLGTDPANCFVFEDSFYGLEAGKRAGMTVIGLATTNRQEDIMDKADKVIKDFNDFTFDKMIALR